MEHRGVLLFSIYIFVFLLRCMPSLPSIFWPIKFDKHAYCINLKSREIREVGDKLLSIVSFSKCLQQPRLGQAKARNEELHVGLYMVVTKVQAFGLSSAAFRCALTGSWIRHKTVITQTCSLIWDTRLKSSGLIHVATVPAPRDLKNFSCIFVSFFIVEFPSRKLKCIYNCR